MVPLAIVARAEHKRLCLRLNNSDVCTPKPNSSGILVHNIYLCNATESNAYCGVGLWRGVPPENVKFNRNDRFRATHGRLVQQCAAAISANQTSRPLDGSAYRRVLYLAAVGTSMGCSRANALARKLDSRRLSRFQGPPYAKCEGILEMFSYVLTERITF